MSRICQICKKGAIIRQSRKLLRGHYNPVGKKKKYPNLQSVFLTSGKKVIACQKCAKTLLKTR